MTLARMAAIPVTIDRRNQPPISRAEFMRAGLLNLGRQIGTILLYGAVIAAAAYLRGQL